MLRSVCREMGGVVFVGVHYSEFRSFEVFAYGDRDFLVSGNILKICNYSFGRGVCKVVAPYVCVFSYFV